MQFARPNSATPKCSYHLPRGKRQDVAILDRGAEKSLGAKEKPPLRSGRLKFQTVMPVPGGGELRGATEGVY